MSRKLKSLQDRAAAVAARLGELTALEDRSVEQDADLDHLIAEADEVRAAIVREEKIVAKEEELRAVVEPASPAKPDPEVAPATVDVRKEKEEAKVEIRSALPHHTELRAFNKSDRDVELAYRMGKWLGATVYGREDDKRWCVDHGVIEARTLTVGGDTAGIVPPEFAAKIVRLVDEYGVAPKVCDVVNMSRDVYNIPKRTGGVTANFVAESASIGQTDPTYAQVQLTAQKLTVATRMSAEYVADSIVNMVDQVALEFATAIAKKVDECAFIGDGTAGFGSMSGVAYLLAQAGQAGGKVSAAAGNTSVETLDVDDFLACIGKVKSYARPGSAWFCSPVVYHAAMARLKFAGGGNTESNLANGSVDKFLGYPVYLVECLNSTLGADANKIKCVFGNMKQAAILARRSEFTARMYDSVYATTDELLLQGKTRFDIKVHDAGTASASGAVVGLATAAA